MFKIIYIFTIIFFWLSWFSVVSQVSEELKQKTSLLRSFAVDMVGYEPKFKNPIPKLILSYFEILMLSLIPLLNIALSFLFSSETFHDELIQRSGQLYKDKFSDWLKENRLEQAFLEYTRGS